MATKDANGHAVVTAALTGADTLAWERAAVSGQAMTEPESEPSTPEGHQAGLAASVLATAKSHRVATLIGAIALVSVLLLMLIPSPNSEASLSQPKSQTSLHPQGSPSPRAGPEASSRTGSGAGATTGPEADAAGPGGSLATRPRALPIRLLQNASRNVRFLFFVVGSGTSQAIHHLLVNLQRIIDRLLGGASSATHPANGKGGSPTDVQAMVAVSGAPPTTPCTLSYVGPNGSVEAPQQLGSMTTDAEGNAIWSGKVAAPGTGTVTVNCNGVSMSGPLQIIDSGSSPLPSSTP